MQTDTLATMTAFLERHHLLSLATVHDNRPYSCSVFYAFDIQQICFIVASDRQTQHIDNVLHNNNVAAVVALETHEVGNIQGIQIQGTMRLTRQKHDRKRYLQRFPYAALMRPTLWCIDIEQMKLTDNRLGFGSKLLWQRETVV